MREITFRFAPESATEQRDIDSHILLRNSEGLCDVFPRPAGTLYGCPDFGLAVFDIRDRDGWLHAHMRKVRQIVFADNHLVGAFQSGVHVALLTHDQARLTRGFLELGPIRGRPVLAVGPVVPDELQCVTSLDGRAGVARDHRDAAKRLEFRRPGPTLHLHDFLDTRDLKCVLRIIGYQLPAGHRWPRDHSILHAGEARIDTVARGADGNITKVDNADLAFAEIAKVLRVLQLGAFDARHRFLRRIGSQVAEPETAVAYGMNDLVVYRLDLGCGHAPTFGGCGFEHRARRRADLAHWNQIVPRAARSIGILIAEFDLVSGRLLHLHARPIGLHFLSHNQRQAGPDTRSHFGAVRHDRHGSIGCNGNEDARVDHSAVRHLSGTSLISRKRLT